MFVQLPPRERTIYMLLISVFLFGAGFVGVQRLRVPPKIEVDIPNSGKGALNLTAMPNVTIPTADGPIIVDVSGAVKSPGVQHLPPGSRVDDAIRAAGGPLTGADLDSINLAAKLTDGQQVVVPKKGTTQALAPGTKTGKHPDQPIDLNTATQEQIQELPGVGPSTAEKILAYRQANGHLTLDDLRAIPGLGAKRIESIRPWVR